MLAKPGQANRNRYPSIRRPLQPDRRAATPGQLLVIFSFCFSHAFNILDSLTETVFFCRAIVCIPQRSVHPCSAFNQEAAQRPNSPTVDHIHNRIQTIPRIPLATCRSTSILPLEETNPPSASSLAQNFRFHGRPCRQSCLTDYAANFDQQSQRFAADSHQPRALLRYKPLSTRQIPSRACERINGHTMMHNTSCSRYSVSSRCASYNIQDLSSRPSWRQYSCLCCSYQSHANSFFRSCQSLPG